MNKTSRRLLWLWGTVVVCLTAGAMYCLWAMLEARDQALAAYRDLSDCRYLALQIQAVRDQPEVAQSHNPHITELAKQLEDAGRRAQISSDALIRISPESERRIGESVFKEKPTQVQLRNVGLREIVAFMRSVSSGSAPLYVKSIRLSAPREQESADRWDAEIVVAHLIYAPPPSGRTDHP